MIPRIPAPGRPRRRAVEPWLAAACLLALLRTPAEAQPVAPSGSEVEEMSAGTGPTVPGTTGKVPGTTGKVPGTDPKVPGTAEKVPGTTEELPGTGMDVEKLSTKPRQDPASTLLQALRSDVERHIVADVLERNPELARARMEAVAAEARAPQVRALPDPVAALRMFVLPPETRAGPQRLSASIQQKLPGFAELGLHERVALLAAAAARAEVEALRLEKLTDTRRHLHELRFLDEQERILTAERRSLERFERTAQARYAAGTGLQQESVRIQAQITRVDTRLLELSQRRATLTAAVNALRDQPAAEPLGRLGPRSPAEPHLDAAELVRRAGVHRPSLAAASARVAAAEARVELAERAFHPDWTVGLAYTLVEGRRDTAGRLAPPEDDGDDILALSASVNLPVRRRKLEAGLAEALAGRRAAEAAERQASASIEAEVGDLAARMPLLHRQAGLLENVLLLQAREALRSAESAYSTGKLDAVDLLDAEVVLFEVQIAIARARADLAVAWARLERQVAHPLEPRSPTPDPEPRS